MSISDKESENAGSIISPRYSSSRANSKASIASLVSNITKQQQHIFSNLSQKCSTIEFTIANIDGLLNHLAEKVQKCNESRETEMLTSLRIKQYEFIISELKATANKQIKKQQRLSEQLEIQKKKEQQLRELNYKLQAKNASLTQKVKQLQGTIKQKSSQIQNLMSLNRKSQSDVETEIRNRSKSRANFENSQTIRSHEQFAELQDKLQELERQFTNQIEKLVSKNNDLNEKISKYQQQVEQSKLYNKICTKQLDEKNISKYQLEIKLNQNVSLYNELEESYSKLVEKSNLNEIILHKQLQEHKVKEVQMKNQFKKQKKLFKSHLSALAEYINNSKYYLTSPTTKEQIDQIKKLIDKSLKKKIQATARQLQYYQSQCKKYKAKNQELELKASQAEKKRPLEVVSQRNFERLQTLEKAQKVSSESNSFLQNRSGDKSQQEKYRGVEEKYKNKVELLRKDIKTRQAKINELEKMQQLEFDKNKEKILELEQQISEKTNQYRKLELKFKEKDYQISQLKNTIKQFEGKLSFITEKLEIEKATNKKITQSKAQNYEQKLKIVKNNYKDLEKKQQQKTIKYNKLKSKYEKYELQASESLKRKNMQIDQLLKQTNKLKTQNRLLEQKVNINQIIENEISKNKTPNSTTSINQDLIDQIQMERQRINVSLIEKQKHCDELIGANTRLNNEIINLKKQLRELKNKVEQMGRQQRFLKEQNRYAKEKIEQFTNKQKEQQQDKHSYFKKQIQKNVINIKKLERANEKSAQQRQNLKKQIEEKNKEIVNLKSQCEKYKEKIAKTIYQMQEYKQNGKKITFDFERKLSEYATKEEQLIEIINYKNRQGSELRQSMKGQQLIIEQESKIKFNIETMTEQLILLDKQTNTDHYQFSHSRSNQRQFLQKQIIPSELILDEQLKQQQNAKQNMIHQIIEPETKETKGNYFSDLIMNTQALEDHFQICEEGEEINIGQTAINLQIKQIFNGLRKQIQKIFNQEDISIDMMKILPMQLEDDFNQFMAYVKEKIYEIKGENNLTFIMAEAGNEPSIQDIQDELQEFISKQPKQFIKLRKIIEEKQSMITSLMNQKTEQQNTINQQQNIQQQGEKLHLQQYSVLKKEIQQRQSTMDRQLLYYQSLKNIIKKMMMHWVDDEDNYDDFQDNINIIKTIYTFNGLELQNISKYLEKYKQLKGVQ